MYFEDQCISYNGEDYTILPINDYFHHARNENFYKISLEELNTTFNKLSDRHEVTFQGRKEDLEKIFANLKVHLPYKENSNIRVLFRLIEGIDMLGVSRSVTFHFNCT